MKPIYTKVFSRERPLLHLQLWYWGEATDPRLWTSESQPYLPYIVFHRIGHTVDAYYDLRGIEWIKNFILEKMKTDPAYVRKMAAEYAKYVEGKKELISKLPALPLPELIEMAEGVRFSWPYLEIGWWAVEALEDKPEYAADLEFFLDIRKKTEPDTTANEQIIIKSLKPAFPLQEKYVRVISFEEAKSGTLPSGEVLESRLKNYFYTNDTLYEEKTLEDIEKIFNIEFERSPDPQSVTELKGQIAYKGKVQGQGPKNILFRRYSDIRDRRDSRRHIDSAGFPTGNDQMCWYRYR